jgi:hypothetical protein
MDLFPEVKSRFVYQGYLDGRNGFAPQPSNKIQIMPIARDCLTFHGENQIVFDIIPCLPDVDEKNGYPYRLRQGIATVEKPFGSDGPAVNLLDPVSIMLGKAGAIRYTGLEDKFEKYKWHMRILSLCIPPYLEEKTRLFKEGKLIRNPAVVARRLSNDMENPDRDRWSYYRAFSGNRKVLDVFKQVVAGFATTDQEVYLPEE